MSERRVLSKKVTDTDKFITMPPTSQALYLHLFMSADDDGFCDQVSISLFKAHATSEDYNLLIRNKFIIEFENGVIVIKHWRVCNTIQRDRYHETIYQDDKEKLSLSKGIYQLKSEDCISLVEEKPKKEKKDKCKEELADDVEAIPLNDGSEWKPTKKQYEEYCRLYSNVDVKTEIKKMRAWSLSNPTRKKTSKGISRFVNSWLSRKQDTGQQNYRKSVSIPMPDYMNDYQEKKANDDEIKAFKELQQQI